MSQHPAAVPQRPCEITAEVANPSWQVRDWQSIVPPGPPRVSLTLRHEALGFVMVHLAPAAAIALGESLLDAARYALAQS